MIMHRAQPTASHFIDGAYVDDEAGTPIAVIYPATGQQIALVHAATPPLVERALAAAKRARKDWAAMSGMERGRILRRAADIIRERNRELSELETLDTGKPLQETLVADAMSGADALEYFGGLAASPPKYSSASAPEVASATRVSCSGLPVSSVSSSESSRFLSRMMSAARRRMRPRAAPGAAFHAAIWTG